MVTHGYLTFVVVEGMRQYLIWAQEDVATKQVQRGKMKRMRKNFIPPVMEKRDFMVRV